ncbi:hypothetical protein QCA50_006521 [Cerrena zonata]|uniref:F-box domain-containing protein n=1 Tax=Cerrena zonata TaxID=2478898 RepID=A0AAW0GEA3_9APHY
MPRESKRQRTVLGEVSSTVDTASQQSTADTDHEPETSSVVTTKPKRNVRGRRGALQSLPEMPIDILIEVLCQLRPVDLLHLSRTTKAFRNLLMVRSSAYIWKEARENVPDLPEPFPGMSEPVYASLCFEPVCTLCFKSGVRDVIWNFRARLCPDCKESKTGDCYDLRTVTLGTSHASIPQMAARVLIMSDGQHAFLISEAISLREAWDELSDEEEKTKFMEDNAKRVEELETHATLCSIWFEALKTGRAEELKEIRKQRYTDIITKLKELGYAEDVDWLEERRSFRTSDQFEKLPAVRQSKPLTARTWQKISPEIIEYIVTKVQPERLQAKYETILERRIPLLKKVTATHARPYRNIFPTAKYLAHLPEFRAILDPSINDVDPTVESFDLLWSRIPDILVSWRAGVQKKTDECIRNRLEGLPSDIPLGDLVLTHSFECKNCRQIIQNSGCALGLHMHNCQAPMSFTLDDMYDEILSRLGFDDWNQWTYMLCSPYALEVLEACGRDRLATTRELDRLDPRFICKSLSCQERGVQTVHNWRDAIFHLMEHRRATDTPCELELFPEEKSRKLATLDLVADRCYKNTMYMLPIWYCYHCEAHKRAMGDIVMHLEEIHHLCMPSENDLFPDPDRPHIMKTVYVVPDNYKDDVESLPLDIRVALEHGRAMFEGEFCFTI